MKTRFFLLLAAMGLLASCEKEIQDVEETVNFSGKTVLSVGIDPGTKTHMGELEGSAHKVYWSNGDQIAVNGTASDELTGVEENTTNVSFTFDGLLSTPYNFIYPASIYTDATHVTLPAFQTYKADGFADGMFPMAGYSSDGAGTISMSHLCAVVKISVLRETAEQATARSGEVDTDKIVAVRFSGRNNEKVSGAFEINYVTPALTAASGTGDDLIVSVAKSQSTSTSTPKDYYLVVPARTYSNGFTITVKDANGHIMTKSKASSWAPEAGKLYNMTAFEFVPSGTDTGIEIDSAEELIAFAEAYNNHEYDSLGDDVLIATLTGDITFDATTSAAFNATGGIGLKDSLFGASENYYFNGIFNGNGHTISGLEATVPLFAAIGGAGHVSNLTIDSSCSFTFTHPNTTELDAGAVVGYHKGEVKNVDVKANVSLVAGEVSQETCLGGIAGRIVEGVVDDCSYSGAISVPSGFQSAAKKIQIGGIVGRISNASGKVQNTNFEGTLYNQGQMILSSGSVNEPYLMIGGIVGLNAGTVDHCSVANHATGVTVTLSGNNCIGTIVTNTTNAYYYALGGIAGRNNATVNDCTNDAAVLNIFSAARGTSGNQNGRFVDFGGIAGYNGADATVSGSQNNGTIVNRAVPKVQCIGGIIGKNFGTVSSSSNQTSGTIEVATSYFDGPDGPRMPYIGGVIGINSGASTTLSNIQNAANITVSQIEDVAGIMVHIGGVIGKSESAFDGSVDSGTISNSGNIEVTHGGVKCSTPTASNDYGLFIGGIAGYATADIKNVTNSGTVTFICTKEGDGSTADLGGVQYVHLGGVAGKVNGGDSVIDVEKCSNSGSITFTSMPNHAGSTSNLVSYYYNYLGGIVGFAQNASIKGDSTTKTTNSASVTGGSSAVKTPKNHDNSFWVGGIVGKFASTSNQAHINYCEVTGSAEIWNKHFTNRGYTLTPPLCGGIAGEASCSSGRVNISNCSIENTASVTATRGTMGGIVGYANHADVNHCTYSRNISSSCYCVGGIAGNVLYGDITNCSFGAAQVRSSQLDNGCGGGIVGYLQSGTINGCSSMATDVSKNGTAVTKSGAIAGEAKTANVDNNIIQNCHYKSGMTICPNVGTDWTDGGGNEADL